jgi:D-glycero-D-manno-heptose 1,7-bisphosphate phosphatase
LDNQEMSRRGVFLDLNGTLVEPLKQERLEEMTLIPGVAEAVARLTAAGFVCPVVTVQSRIAKGLFSMAEFQTWFATFAADLKAQGALVDCPGRIDSTTAACSRMAARLRSQDGTELRYRYRWDSALVVGPYVCPHRYGEACPCKKPNVLLYQRAAREHQLTVADSFVIGDSPDDVRAARRLGARGCLVRTGWASDPRVVETALEGPNIVVDSFAHAVDWILGSEPWRRGGPSH